MGLKLMRKFSSLRIFGASLWWFPTLRLIDVESVCSCVGSGTSREVKHTDEAAYSSQTCWLGLARVGLEF